ncbi:DUF2076 domain-containing protein [Antarcticirhabdus aurantiaca]|uniref:DUF2076 domain-containing protein n=1 Tax=Antarcticirhabdus aurantiaca TaxID=2606717 RepID=A0ACD4NSC6_9HYPH|nr:DUF2076 domain-containing protein [Antarcticirhabdus aurantiaca]WAJ29761.1 DUF2076 domain-containing protein [Jeongeuplla avenae]
MNRDEQNLIQNLFGKLSEAERTAPPREAEADRFIQESVARQPAAPYYMAQTIIIQEQALEAAQARIQALEAQASRPQSSGGFFGSLFGGGAAAPRQQPAAYGRQPGYGQAAAPQASGPWNSGPQAGYGQQPGAMAAPGRGGGGFMAGAAQTAMGVAGGVVLGSMLSDMMFGDDPAAAVEGAVADAGAAAEEQVADMGGEDFGGDFEDI